MEKTDDVIYERLYVRRGSSGSNSGHGRFYEITETIKELPATVTSAVKSSLDQWHMTSSSNNNRQNNASTNRGRGIRGSVELILGELGDRGDRRRSVEETIKELPSPSDPMNMSSLPAVVTGHPPPAPSISRRWMQRRCSEDLILSSSAEFTPSPPSIEQKCRGFPGRRRMVSSRRTSEDLILSGKMTSHLQELHQFALQKNARNFIKSAVSTPKKMRRRGGEDDSQNLVVSDDDGGSLDSSTTTPPSSGSGSSQSDDDAAAAEGSPRGYHGCRRSSDSNLILPSLQPNKKVLQKRRLSPNPGMNHTKTPKQVTSYRGGGGDSQQDGKAAEGYDFVMQPRKCNSISEGQSLHDSLEQLNGPEFSTSEKVERFLQSLNITDSHR